MKVTIDRTKWLRGKGSEESYLWILEADKGCCLGHAINQTNKIPLEDLNFIPAPAGLYNKIRKLKLYLEKEIHLMWVRNAMDINDKIIITEKEREEKLIELFKDGGLELEFYN